MYEYVDKKNQYEMKYWENVKHSVTKKLWKEVIRSQKQLVGKFHYVIWIPVNHQV